MHVTATQMSYVPAARITRCHLDCRHPANWLFCTHLGFDLRLVGEDDHHVTVHVRILHLRLDSVVEKLGQGCGAG
jgi:hypothetical protein